jgi:copper chaperone
MKTTTLRVTGMTCGHCVQAVERALRDQSGVHSARVDLGAGLAEVSYEGEVPSDTLIAAVESEGYTASLAETGTPLEG